jgi:hypothetical protein
LNSEAFPAFAARQSAASARRRVKFGFWSLKFLNSQAGNSHCSAQKRGFTPRVPHRPVDLTEKDRSAKKDASLWLNEHPRLYGGNSPVTFQQDVLCKKTPSAPASLLRELFCQ